MADGRRGNKWETESVKLGEEARMCFLSRSWDVVCLGRARLTISDRFPHSLQEASHKTIVQRGSVSVREQDMAIKALQSYRLSHEGRKTPLAPPRRAPGKHRAEWPCALHRKSRGRFSKEKLFCCFQTAWPLQELGESKFTQTSSLSSGSAAECWVRLSAVIEASHGARKTIYLSILSEASWASSRSLLKQTFERRLLILLILSFSTELYNRPPPVTGRVHGRHQSPRCSHCSARRRSLLHTKSHAVHFTERNFSQPDLLPRSPETHTTLNTKHTLVWEQRWPRGPQRATREQSW